ncbi:hypothetical protein OBBRIDRAFT_643745 [Obba rivulosa]|uniref:F-box domain-containing protein n=1 Tax=Obba rivulosa TaxID=1052685 RepID=A0A8E2J5P2_9APHY|nr:hypothetical protein OBBRIDRAFT_643745 [Obba rivulosa]
MWAEQKRPPCNAPVAVIVWPQAFSHIIRVVQFLHQCIPSSLVPICSSSMRFLPTKRLPLEIYDEVIDWLHDDYAALAACSLTCKAWSYRSQFLLFRKVALHADTWQAFEHVVQCSPHLANFVRVLILSQYCRSSRHKLAYSIILEWLGAIPRVLAVLPGVVKLELCSLLIEGTLRDALARELPLVQELRLNRCTLPGIARLAELVCFFPQLKKFKVGDLFITPPETGAVLPKVVTRPALEVVKFPSRLFWMDRTISTFLHWLIAESLHTQIRKLELILFRYEEAEVVRDILRDIGPALQDLSFSLDPDNRSDTDLLGTPLDLSPCTGLRVLAFSPLRLCRDNPHHIRSFAWVSLLLSQVSSPNLEHVIFRFRAGASNISDLDDFEWDRIDGALSHSRFSKLRRVTFEFCRGKDLVGVVGPYVKNRVPQLNAKGILLVAHRLREV